MKINNSSSRMRVLVRLSPSSFIITTPAPASADPSRRIAHSLEITDIDVIEAGMAGFDAHEFAAGLNHRAGDCGAHILRRFNAEAVRRRRHAGDAFDPADGGGEPAAARLDMNHMRAAEHVARQILDAAGEADAAAMKQRHAVADRLHEIE